jgi:hypothetical protein
MNPRKPWTLAVLALPAVAAFAQTAPNSPPPPATYQLPPNSQPPPEYQAATAAIAQEPLSKEPAFVPYHVHRDMRNGHDHVYPDRGSIVRNVPPDSLVVNYAGVSYRFHGGVWFEPRGPAFVVVAPPIGLIVQTLPAFATSVRGSGGALLYANETFYRARPDIGGYEVVNDPLQDPAARIAAPMPTPAQMAMAQVATTIPAATVAAIPAQVATAAQVPVAAEPAAVPAVQAAAQPTVPVVQAAAQPTVPVVQAAQPNLGAPGAAAPIAPAPALAAPPAQTAPAPSTQAAAGGAGPAVWPTAAPTKGQSADAQARDRYDCYQFAVAQTGFDPLRANGGVPQDQMAERKAAYARAQAACLEGRGYSVP